MVKRKKGFFNEQIDLSKQEKAGLLLSGVFLGVSLIYALLSWVVLDGQVKITSGDTLYLVNTPELLTLYYLFVTVFSILLFVRLFLLVPDISFAKFFKIVYLIPHLMISTDIIGHRLYVASTSLFVGLVVLAFVPLVSSNIFPQFSGSLLFILGAAFSFIAVINTNKLLK